VHKILDELKQRRIWRVLVAYPSVSFVLLEAVEFFVNNYGLDARYLTATLITAIVLMPAAIVWNWRHGEVGQQPFTRAETGTYAVIGLAVLVAVGWYWRVTPADTSANLVASAPVRSIAVLPFENTGNDTDVQYLCDGIAESLINWLATVPGVKVLSKTTAFRHRDDATEPDNLAKTLGVDSVVHGQLERRGDQIVISASLIDIRDDTQLWGERLVRSVDEVIYLERSIVAAIKEGLRLKVADEVPTVFASGGTDVAEAYQHYQRGHFLIQTTDMQLIEEGLDELRAAIRIDPRFALPYADIADALSQLIFYGVYGIDALLGEARNAAYTAVALAPELPEAQTALATVHQYFTFDWNAADEAYEAAIAMSPQSPVPFHRYADYLWLTLRLERAREMAQRAIEIDPLDESSMHAVGITALVSGDFAAAVDAFGEWSRFYPGSRWAYVKHALALSLNGQCEAALSEVAEADRLAKGRLSALMEAWKLWAFFNCSEEELYAASKERLEALLSANPSKQQPAHGYLYALEGDTERMIDLLQRMVESASPGTLYVQLYLLDYMEWPVLETLSKDPRYLKLLHELNFPKTEWSVN
jgi:TolB-like protein